MDVVTIGHVSIDRVKMNKKVKVQLGGAVVYSAMAAKIFGKTGIVSRVGEDFPVRFYDVLKEAGINRAGLKKVKGKSTSFSISYNGDGIASYDEYGLNVGKYIRPKDMPGIYLNAKAFHIGPMAASKQESFLDFMRENSNAIVSLNTHMGYLPKYRKALYSLISKADVFTLNDEEAVMLTGMRSLSRALNALKRIQHNLIIVTVGVYGSVVIEGGEITFFPSLYQPKIVDLTGCGDAFAGSFISSYVKTKDALKSANIANSVASIMATDWNFNAVKNLKFKTMASFQSFVLSRQRSLRKNQPSIENFF